MSDDVKNEIRARIVKAQADMDVRRGAVLDALDRIYVDPVTAYHGMQKFMKTNTEAALMERLEKEPWRFGGLRGHLGSGSKWTPFGGDKAIAKEALTTLPALVKSTLEAEKSYRSLQKAYDIQFPGPLGPDKGPDGLDLI